jgi:hypothetical protein
VYLRLKEYLKTKFFNEKLIDNQMLECLIKTEDKNKYRKILEQKKEQMQSILKDSKKDLNVIIIYLFFEINSIIN